MHAIASEKSAVPNGIETAGADILKMNAAMRRVAVVVCLIPAGFRCVSNIATFPGCRVV